MEQKGCTSYRMLYKLEETIHGLYHENVDQRSIFDFFSHARETVGLK